MSDGKILKIDGFYYMLHLNFDLRSFGLIFVEYRQIHCFMGASIYIREISQGTFTYGFCGACS